MKILKTIGKILFGLLIFALLVLPLGLLYQVSLDEMRGYEAPESPVLREISVGAPQQAYRMDVKEFATVTGTFTSKKVDFMMLDYNAPGDIRWVVSVGEEIQEGQILGYYRDSSVVSSMDGIIEEIYTFSQANSYLKIRRFSPLELECHVTEEVLSTLKRGSEALHLEDGTAVTLGYASNAQNADGTRTVWLTLGSNQYTYGQSLKDLPIYTGTTYPQTLVLDSDCVYQKDKGESEPWYVRHVTDNGYFIEEIQVKVIYSSGDMVCVSGVNEGDWFDSGYKELREGDAE